MLQIKNYKIKKVQFVLLVLWEKCVVIEIEDGLWLTKSIKLF